MRIQVNIAFDQLVHLAKRLPVAQWNKLKQEVESAPSADKVEEDFPQYFSSSPTFTQKQLDEIAKTNKLSLTEWKKVLRAMDKPAQKRKLELDLKSAFDEVAQYRQGKGTMQSLTDFLDEL